MPTEKPGRAWTTLWLSFCLLLALAVRSHDLGGQSLWWDESLSLHRAQLSPAAILSNRIDLTDGVSVVSTIDNHPPLYFLALAAAVRVFGASDFALRLPSLAFGLLLIPLLFTVGRRLAGESAGRGAALAGVLSPMYLWYSQEARMYMMAPFLGLLSLYGLLRALERDGARRALWLFVWSVASAAMLLTHYLTVLILAAEVALMGLAALRGGRPGRWAWLLLLALAGGAAFARYALAVAPPASVQTGFSFVPLLILLRDVLNSFSLGLSVNVDDVIFVDALFLLVALMGFLPSARQRAASALPAALVIGCYVLVPLALTYLAGYIRPIYMNSRHLIIITPAFYLAVGAGLAQLWPRRGLFLATLAVLTTATVFSWQQFFTNPEYQKDDHRAWGQFLRANVQPGDVMVLNPPHIYDLYEHYAASDIAWIGLPGFNASPDATWTALERLSTQYRNIWLALSYTPPWGDSDRTVQHWLDGTLTKTMDRSFHSYASEVRVTRYATRPPLSATMQPISQKADLELSGGLHFLGFDVVSGRAQPGASLGYSLYLRTGEQPTARLKASLRLLDESGQIWAQSDQQLAALPSPERWRSGLIAREDANLLIPLATPAGDYRVELVIYAEDTGRALSPVGGERMMLGVAVVERAAHNPAPAELPLTNRLDGRAGPLELLGVNVPSRRLGEGDVLSFDAYWRAAAVVPSEYAVVLSLLDARGVVRAEQSLPLSTAGRGAMALNRGEVVRGQYRWRLGRDVSGGEFRLRLALRNLASGDTLPVQHSGLGVVRGRELDVARITVQSVSRVYGAPPLDHAVAANLGNQVTVLGFALSPDVAGQSLQVGQAITLTVYMQARELTDTNYSVFVHLIDSQERIWGQHDAPAGGASHTTALWHAGEVVSTVIPVTLSPLTSTDQVLAVMGLYDPATQERLPVVGAPPSSNHITLFAVGVTH